MGRIVSDNGFVRPTHFITGIDHQVGGGEKVVADPDADRRGIHKLARQASQKCQAKEYSARAEVLHEAVV